MTSLERLKEKIVSDAFERREIMSGQLAERLIRERAWAAAEIERLTAENERLLFALRSAKDYLDIGASHATTGAALRAIGDGLSAVQQAGAK